MKSIGVTITAIMYKCANLVSVVFVFDVCGQSKWLVLIVWVVPPVKEAREKNIRMYPPLPRLPSESLFSSI